MRQKESQQVDDRQREPKAPKRLEKTHVTRESLPKSDLSNLKDNREHRSSSPNSLDTPCRTESPVAFEKNDRWYAHPTV
jgi:hypothetical protein